MTIATKLGGQPSRQGFQFRLESSPNGMHLCLSLFLAQNLHSGFQDPQTPFSIQHFLLPKCYQSKMAKGQEVIMTFQNPGVILVSQLGLANPELKWD